MPIRVYGSVSRSEDHRWLVRTIVFGLGVSCGLVVARIWPGFPAVIGTVKQNSSGTAGGQPTIDASGAAGSGAVSRGRAIDRDTMDALRHELHTAIARPVAELEEILKRGGMQYWGPTVPRGQWWSSGRVTGVMIHDLAATGQTRTPFEGYVTVRAAVPVSRVYNWFRDAVHAPSRLTVRYSFTVRYEFVHEHWHATQVQSFSCETYDHREALLKRLQDEHKRALSLPGSDPALRRIEREIAITGGEMEIAIYATEFAWEEAEGVFV